MIKYWLFFFVIFTSCNSNFKSDSAEEETVATEYISDAYSESVPVEEAGESKAIEPEQKTMIIKTADYKIQVKNVNESTKNIEKTITKYNSYVANMNLTTSSYNISNSLIIRVPQNSFKELLDELGNEAIFTDFIRISSEDVSEEYVDIETRLKTKREVRDRYIDILKNKAKTVEDVLKAEEQIRILQEEIEAKEGRMKYLQNRISQSTINLEIYQEVEYKDSPEIYKKSYFVKLFDSLEAGWSFITRLILFIVTIWPLDIIILLLIWKRKWVASLFKRKK